MFAALLWSLLPGVLPAAVAAPASGETPWFEDVAAEVGVVFTHQDGRSGRYYPIETVASGGGWLDIEGDGDYDLYLINGAATPGGHGAEGARNRLFENRDGRFVDATEHSGLGDRGYGMGMCVGDSDGDGVLDLLVTNFGPDRLLRGLGDGRFTERAAAAGVADAGWSVSCAFGDLDGDGDLDLYVSRYLDFDFAHNPACTEPALSLRDYCHPARYRGLPDRLYINQGDGTFREQARARGIAQGVRERGLGVALSDLDQDGDLDIVVANDESPNRLYRNDGEAYFEDVAMLAGTAVSAAGEAQAGMGIAIGDVDGDGMEELFITNYALESNVLYRNLGDGLFGERTRAAGLATASYRPLGWGTAFLDVDNDGDLDLAVANGHVMAHIARQVPGQHSAQPNQLFLNDGSGRFVETDAGPAFSRARVSRALAVADFDDDGRLDLLITNTNGTAEVLRNRHRTAHHWLGLALEGAAGNRLAIGARATVRAGARAQVRAVSSGGGVLAQSDLRLHFGLGSFAGPVQVEIRWTRARQQTFTVERLDRYVAVRDPGR